MRILMSAASLVLAVVSLTGALAADEPSDRPPTKVGAETVGEVVTPFIFEGDLRDLPLAPAWKPGDPIKEIPRRGRPIPQDPFAPPYERPVDRDPLLAVQEAAPKPLETDGGISTILNFNGQGFTGVNPPDTVGDVGPDHYIQMINAGAGARFTIHNKNNGSVIAGPITLDNLGSGNCASGFGDPIVLYDRDADRWMLSEFAGSGNRMCVYVSLTSDPVSGGWCNYDFTATNFPDYPKYAVWPDAYYVSTNENLPAAYAFDRENMLNCAPARPRQRFTAPPLSGFGFQATLPADVDGAALPPAGAPGIFIRHNDTERHGPGGFPTTDLLQLFEFDVDWNNPNNSTFTGPFNIEIADISSDLCGFFTFSCFDQPTGGSDLDPLREINMWRSQYRNFGTHETLVGNLGTEVSGNDHGGVRWYELRKTGANWFLFQEGTYAPDAADRWMGSAAMDIDGNVAVGYNIVDETGPGIFPGLRFIGRLESDPPGTMPHGEFSLIEGSARNSSNRYGDYSSLNVDPADDCTFWFTGEHNQAGSWSTRIGSFRFDTCEGGGGGIPCGDIFKYNRRCGAAGAIGVRVRMVDESHSGETVTIAVDGVPHELTIFGQVAGYSEPNAGAGQHTIELLDPPGCFNPTIVTCPVAPEDLVAPEQ